jgi:hypothetical protein
LLWAFNSRYVAPTSIITCCCLTLSVLSKLRCAKQLSAAINLGVCFRKVDGDRLDWVRSASANRTPLHRCLGIYQVRGHMKTFGLVVPRARVGSSRPTSAGSSMRNMPWAAIVLPLLEAWCAIRNRAAELDRLLLRKVRDDANCRRLMTAPGIGAVGAASYVAAIESPVNFKPRARRGCLGRARAPEVPVGRNGLRWPYLAAGRRTVARAALRGRNRDPDPGALCQRAALLGSGAQESVSTSSAPPWRWLASSQW